MTAPRRRYPIETGPPPIAPPWPTHPEIYSQGLGFSLRNVVGAGGAAIWMVKLMVRLYGSKQTAIPNIFGESEVNFWIQFRRFLLVPVSNISSDFFRHAYRSAFGAFSLTIWEPSVSNPGCGFYSGVSNIKPQPPREAVPEAARRGAHLSHPRRRRSPSSVHPTPHSPSSAHQNPYPAPKTQHPTPCTLRNT